MGKTEPKTASTAKNGQPPVPSIAGVTKAVQNVDDICERAKERIIAKINEHFQSHKTSPWSGKPLVELERSMKKLYKEWGEDIKGEFKESMPKLMREFYDAAVKAAMFDGVKKAIIGDPDTAAIDRYLESAFEQVAMRTDKMLYEQIALLRRISAEVFRGTSLTGETRREISRQLFEKVIGIPGFEFIDKGGHKWSWKSYFEMLVRTELMNSARAIYDDQCAREGYDVMLLTISGNPCPKCERFEGKMFSLTGATAGLPTKDDLLAAGVFHPNCTHSYSAVPPSRIPEDIKALNSK